MEESAVVERVTTPRGELVLRRSGGDYELISNGAFLMDTRDGRSERLLVRAALEAHPAPRSLLIGGLGVGFSLVEAVTDDRLRRITVVEIERPLVDWHTTHLERFSRAGLTDPRVEVVVDDLASYLAVATTSYDVICLDIDNGPDWTVTADNRSLYDEAGTAAVTARLTAGGVLAVWSAHRVPAYEALLQRLLDDVQVLETAVARGAPDVVYLGRKP